MKDLTFALVMSREQVETVVEQCQTMLKNEETQSLVFFLANDPKVHEFFEFMSVVTEGEVDDTDPPVPDILYSGTISFMAALVEPKEIIESFRVRGVEEG